MTAVAAGVDARTYADRHGLRTVGARPPLGQYLQQLWHRFGFIQALAVNRVRAQTQQQRLGVAWTVIQPALLALVYLLVFGLLLGAADNVKNYGAYLAIGVFTFQFLAQSLNSGAKSITGNATLIRGMNFPRAVLPLATTMQQFLLLLPVVALMLAVTLATGEPVTWRWLLLLPAFALMTLFSMGLALLVARLAAGSRDILQLLPFTTRLWFYLSGVFWSIDRLDKLLETQYAYLHAFLKPVAEYNPGHLFLQLVRSALLGQREPHVTDGSHWLIAAAWAMALFLIGIVMFWRAEEKYGRV